MLEERERPNQMSEYGYDIGDKVVCIDANFFDGVKALYKQLPVQDQTYVVRDMRIGVAMVAGCPLVKTGEVSTLLIGVVNPKSTASPFHERGFAGWRFMPLQEWNELKKLAKKKPK